MTLFSSTSAGDYFKDVAKAHISQAKEIPQQKCVSCKLKILCDDIFVPPY